MAERVQGWPVWAITALALAAIGGGLAVTGGPMQGRVERRDDLRRSDIAALARQANCLSAAEGRADGDLSATALCPDPPRLDDPYTGTPYRVEPLDGRHMRLCAEFEQDEDRLSRRWAYGLGEWQGGCVVIQLTQPG